MSSIGPHIPAHLLRQKDKEREEEEEEEEEEAYAPELPPDLLVNKKPNAPIHISTQGKDDYHISDESSDGEEIGPKPMGTRAAEGDDDPVRAFMERERRRIKAQEEKEAGTRGQKLQREEWMLVPPSSSSLLGSFDQPGKINKARQFSRNSGANARPSDSSLWTETPAEKQARMRDEVEGKRKRATDMDGDAGDSEFKLRNRKRSKETEELVENYIKKRRGGKSLLEMHQSKQSENNSSNKKSEEQNEEVIWDHERDMSVGGRLMDEKQRTRMIQDARGLSSRFSKGKEGSFL